MGPAIDLAASPLVVGGASVLAGLTSSLHCFGMCGPLACAASAPEARRWRSMAGYQAMRVASYGLSGGVVGVLGGQVLEAADLHPPAWIAWVTAALLVLSAVGLGGAVPRIPGGAQLVRLGARAGARFTPPVRAGLLGVVTPLLPCGLAYGVFATALAAGSPGSGAVVAGGFALGGVPALVLAQVQADWLHRVPAGAAFVLRRVLPIAAAAVLVWRALSVQAGGSCCG